VATKGKTEDMILSNFELNSYKQSSADKSALATSNLKDASLK